MELKTVQIMGKKENDTRYRRRHRNEINQKQNEKYYINYTEKLEKRKVYRLQNRERINTQKRIAWKKTHEPFIPKYVKLGMTKEIYKKQKDIEYYQKNKTKWIEYGKIQYQKNKEKILLEHKKMIRFKDKRIKLAKNPRTGICSNCGMKGLTNIHHLEYNESEPLSHTRELCIKCHIKQHPRERDPFGRFV